MSKREKSLTRSFRISESVFKALNDDAKSRNVSVNTLVNQLLLAYTEWGRFIEKAGTIYTSKAAYMPLLNGASDEAIIEACRVSGSDTPKALILAKHGVLSLRTVLDFIRAASTYGGYAEYNEVEAQGKTVVTLIHDLGRKGSLYITQVLESTFATLNIHPKMSSSDHSVVIEI